MAAMVRPFALSILAASLAACATPRAPDAVPPMPAADTGWRAVATSSDRERLRNWRTSWVEALTAAESAGHGAEISKAGALFLPDAAIPGPGIPAGDYRCKTTKLGAKQFGLLDYVAYDFFECRVTADAQGLRLEKRTGSQRQAGRIYPDTDRRQVFLGTLLLGDETRPFRYGTDATRNVAGHIERVGPDRWRLVMPSPAFESLVDVLEIIPAG